MKIDGVAAVVTGGASGLGEATARALAAKGAKVAIFDRDADKGEKVAAEIGGVFCEVDVTSDEKVAAAFDKARAAHGQERILVNCAGVANAAKTVGKDKATGELKRYPMNQFELAIGINLVGSFRCIAYSAYGMVQTDPLEDGELELVDRVALDRLGLLVAADRLHGVGDAGAIDADPLLAIGLAALREAGIDALVRGHVDMAEDPANLRRDLLALVRVPVEDRDLHPLRGERPRRALAKAGGATGHHCRDATVEFHLMLPLVPCRAPRAKRALSSRPTARNRL
jgi:hypothetical protein